MSARTTRAARATLTGTALAVCIAGCAAASGSTAAHKAEYAKAMRTALAQKRSSAATLRAQKLDLDAKGTRGGALPDEGTLPRNAKGSKAKGDQGLKLPPRMTARVKHVHGTYVGPRNDGRNRCGYVSAGAGPQEASAFSLVGGATCRTARVVAAAAARHESGDRRYHASGFSCRGTKTEPVGVLHYRCSDGRRSITFVIS